MVARALEQAAEQTAIVTDDDDDDDDERPSMRRGVKWTMLFSYE